MTFTEDFLEETVAIVQTPRHASSVEALAHGLAAVRERGGRLFILGVGGSAGHASHAVNDFRKICGFEAYAPTDNVSELTARANDEGWDTTLQRWLKGSRLDADDGVLVFSVGGGNAEKNVSTNIVRGARAGQARSAPRSSASSAATAATPPRLADACVVDPAAVRRRASPRTPRGCARVVWHLLVSHPALQRRGDQVGVRRMTHELRQGLHRRRRRLHRQPLRRPPARRRRRPSRSRVYDNFSSGRDWHLERGRRRPAADASSAATWSDLATLDRRRWRGHDAVIHLASNPDIAAAVDRTRRSTSTRAPCSPTTSSRPRGEPESSASSTPRGSGVYGDLGELEAAEDHGPLVPDVDLRREQARRRGADLASYCRHVRLHGARVPLRQRGRPAPDPRRRLRLRAPAARRPDPAARSSATAGRASPTSTSRTSIDAVLLRAPRRPTTPFDVFNVATGDYITVTEIAELAMAGARPRRRERRPSSTPAATGAGRATCRWSGSTPADPVAWAGATSAPGRRRSRDSMTLHGRRRAGRLLTVVTAPPAVFLDRDGVLNRRRS